MWWFYVLLFLTVYVTALALSAIATLQWVLMCYMVEDLRRCCTDRQYEMVPDV